jgi:hypothetical protein
MQSTGLDEELWDEMMKCWSSNPDKRPTASTFQAFMSQKAARPSTVDDMDEDRDF